MSDNCNNNTTLVGGAEEAQGHSAAPPRRPDPSSDGKLRPQDVDGSTKPQIDEPLVLESADWDITSISPLAALLMLIQAAQALSFITGEVPPTPPLTRPPTPKAPTSHPDPSAIPTLPGASSPTSPESPVSPSCAPIHTLATVPIGSPEVQRDEAMPTFGDVGAHALAEAVAIRHMAISRRFFLKSAPQFTLSDYLLRLHKYCPHSPGVYLAAAAWIHRLCVSDTLVPATPRTVHRLCLATIRVASKTLEDNKWPQERIAKVGGIALHELTKIEVSLCFLLDFNLLVQAEEMQSRMWQLQYTTRQGLSMRKRLSDGFRMRLPPRSRPEGIQAA